MGNACTLAPLAILASLASLALLTGCAPGPREERPAAARSEIQGGSLDVRDTAVVGVVLADPQRSGFLPCSGTLIAPNLVLTAQHCVAGTRPSVDCATSVFGPVAAPGEVGVTASPEMWRADASWTHADEVSVPPGAPALCGRDLALIILPAPLDARVTPVAPRLDEAVRPDEPYDAVGYGVSGGRHQDGGLRRRRDRLRVVCVGEACDSEQVEDGEWRGDHGACNGDSGGPALDEGGGVIGVTSRGPRGCEHPIYGGLAVHAGWIRSQARRAAELGDYAAPAWAGGEGAHEQRDAEPSSCSWAPGSGREASARAWALLAALVALVALTRRRR